MGQLLFIPHSTTDENSIISTVLNSDLNTLAGEEVGQIILTAGDTSPSDGMNDFWRWLGPSGVVDGFRIRPGSGGNWQRAIDDSRIDIQKFGARPDGVTDCTQALTDLISWATGPTGPSAGSTDKAIYAFFKAAPRSYFFDSNTGFRPPGTNHNPLNIVGEYIPYSASTARYADPIYDSDDFCAGSLLRAKPGCDLFLLENDGINPGTGYHRLYLERIAMVATGAGRCIAMTSPPGDNQSGRVILRDTLFAGANIGWQINSFEAATHIGNQFIGCNAALKIGDVDTNDSTAAQFFYGTSILGCSIALDLNNALDLYMWGGLFQGLDVVLRMPENSTARNVLLQGIHLESYDKWLEIDPTVTDAGVTWQNIRLASGAGLISPSGPIDLHGSGWTFDKVNDTSSIAFIVDANQDTILRDSGYNSLNTASEPSHKLAIYLDNVLQHPKNIGSFSGTFTPNCMVHGCIIELQAEGPIHFGVPVNYPTGKEIRITIYQAPPTGGYNITFDATWECTGTYSDTGNASGTRAYIFAATQSNGVPVVNGFTPWVLI